VNLLVCLDEMVKLGTISDAEAQKAIDRLESLEKSKPTAGQVGRYGALGAVGGALTKVLGHTIEHGVGGLKPRSLAASAATGAVGSGAIPLVRAALDRKAEEHKIKKYLEQEHALPKQAESPQPLHGGSYGKNPEAYGGPPNFGPRQKVSFASFCDEIMKSAATISELQGAYRRIAPLRTKMSPSSHVMTRLVGSATPEAVHLRDIGAMMGPQTIPRPGQMGMIRSRVAEEAANMRSLGVPEESIAAAAEQTKARVEQSANLARQAGGSILMPQGGVSGWTKKMQRGQGVAPIAVPQGPAEQRAANIMTGIHEGFERKVRRSPGTYFSHFKPGVVHDEHNMVAGLTGPGSEEGRAYWQRARTGQEGLQHGETLQTLYGDKAQPWMTYGQGPKMTKAMRKDIERRWPEAKEQILNKVRGELEKTALDVRLSTVPGMGACVGKYFKPEMVAQHGVLQEVAKGRPHLVVQKPLEEFRTMLSGQRDYVNNPELLDAASRAAQGMTRKHELTHYLRSKAGKMEGYGKPGALNVLRTAREELAGHRTGLRAFSKMDAKTQGEAAKGVVPGTMASLRQAYPQGLWNAVLGRSGG